MHKYKNLNVWIEGRKLVKQVYELTATFPTDERFGLVTQMRRAAVSILSNTAEGAGRRTNGEYQQFLGIANGSAFELEAQMTISCDLGFKDERTMAIISDRVDHVSRMIVKLQDSLSR